MFDRFLLAVQMKLPIKAVISRSTEDLLPRRRKVLVEQLDGHPTIPLLDRRSNLASDWRSC